MEPRDVIAVARRILHLANRGPGRLEFLREVSRIFLEFSGCDALDLRIGADDRSGGYRWRASRTGEERFAPLRFPDPRASAPPALAGDAAPPRGDLGSGAPWYEDLMESAATGALGPRGRCITSAGSFWTGDAPVDLALTGPTEPARGGAGGVIVSLAVIPFDIAPNRRGVIALQSGRRHVFTGETIGRHEALAQTLGLAIDDRRAQHALRERVKELSCLYGIARVLEEAEWSIEETLERVVRLLPPAWQFPDIVAARLRVDDHERALGDLGRAAHRHAAAIVIEGVIRGTVEVGYVEERPEFIEGAFLTEEHHLLAAVARETALHVQRCEARAERRQLTTKMRQADRLATLGQLAAGLAHEINEPLGGILGFAQLVRRNPDLPATVTGDIDKIIRSALHARDIVRKLMLFARQSPPVRAAVKLNAIVQESLGLLSHRLRESGIETAIDLDPADPELPADAVQLHQVVVNLCVNAIQAMRGGGRLSIRTRRGSDGVSLVIEDTGTGIPPDVAERLFEPFFTTKPPEEGTGLGLSVVHGIVTLHGGEIGFVTEPGKGTRFEVRLPSVPPERETRSASLS
ncbi:MAG: Adaptive-response sensory-kinase SasA [Phycisphaerae bacterium]|nr:Adaptive-response sensory-kinase SasA [Phycisphaerae bacterium]